MASRKKRIQSLIFDKKFFKNKNSVKRWVKDNNYIIDNRLKQPVMKLSATFRVRQRNPDWFNKKTFKVLSLGKGVKGVFGYLKQGR